MACSENFIQYLQDQLRDAGNIFFKRMFGEYGVYCNEKMIGCVCNDQLFLKITKKAGALLKEKKEVPPYPGAKPNYLIEELEDRAYVVKIVQATYEDLPLPKPKVKK